MKGHSIHILSTLRGNGRWQGALQFQLREISGNFNDRLILPHDGIRPDFQVIFIVIKRKNKNLPVIG